MPMSLKKTLFPLFTIVLLLFPLQANAAFETAAKHAIALDHTTGNILFEKDAHTPMPPSSMTKLMTIYIVFDYLKRGIITMDTTFRVSEKAWRKGGSKTFVKLGDNVAVKDLLQGVIVQSGNDATIVLAEGLGATEESFANIMNTKAKELGLKHSHFLNSTGWPEDGHYMSAYDIATLGRHLAQDFPEYYHFFKEESFTYNNITQPNRNILLERSLGVDGLKTGHTDDGGYGIAISGEQEGRRVVVVVNGLKSERERADAAEKLLVYGYRFFENKTLFSADTVVDNAAVWLGERPTVPLTPGKDIVVSVPKLSEEKITLTVSLQEPVPSPVEAGAELATLHVRIPGKEPISYPLYAKEAVGEAGLIEHITRAAEYYLQRF